MMGMRGSIGSSIRLFHVLSRNSAVNSASNRTAITQGKRQIAIIPKTKGSTSALSTFRMVEPIRARSPIPLRNVHHTCDHRPAPRMYVSFQKKGLSLHRGLDDDLLSTFCGTIPGSANGSSPCVVTRSRFLMTTVAAHIHKNAVMKWSPKAGSRRENVAGDLRPR